jgi:ABC-2 type transport system ATP-binding protein
MVAGSVLTLRLADAARIDEAAAAVASLAVGEPPQVNPGEREIRLTVTDADASPEAIRRLDARRLAVVSVELQQPSLDDVFLTLTGHPAEQATDNSHAEEVAA